LGGIFKRLDLLQRFEAVHAGKPDVEQDEIEGTFAQKLEASFAGGDGGSFVTFVLQDSGERLLNSDFVVHDEDVVHGQKRVCRSLRRLVYAEIPWAASTASGSSGIKRAPTGWFSSTRMEPWWSSMMRLTIAKPSPVPRFLVEKYGRKSFSFISRVTPCPV